ncbi:alpha/beta fold hydrolase [Planomonospora sp. ID67723]|uniref:alpha/beta fold hydrolase n=1 Tax=Planomonospora sp. ID67723 TaxID=2738134 RepID=UPI0018C3D961|nr:alpha/beta fold hydrolase [Planomonospora sp. ID67723]MBG0830777.1 alpha/beta fold hydrolase [Planomonospora sp. ID67723]
MPRFAPMVALTLAVVVSASACGRNGPEPELLGAVRQSVTCTGTGSPAVVMVHGIGDRANSGNLADAQRVLSDEHRTCRYDRPGTGQSPDPARTGRAADDLVSELAAVADHADPAAPVILVAHSFGGYPALLFADRHPERVAGMVLADTVDPGHGLLAALGVRTWKDVRQGREGLDLEAVEREVARTGSLGELPLVVLRRGKGVSEPWLKAQQDLAAKSSRSRLMVAGDSGHEVPGEDPEAVGDAVAALAGL